MIILKLPTSTDPSVPDYRQTTALAGRDYHFRFHWNQRQGRWHMDIADERENWLARGLPLVLGARLLAGLVDARLPPGDLLVVDFRGLGRLPDIDQLGGEIALVYIEDEADALVDAPVRQVEVLPP